MAPRSWLALALSLGVLALCAPGALGYLATSASVNNVTIFCTTPEANYTIDTQAGGCAYCDLGPHTGKGCAFPTNGLAYSEYGSYPNRPTTALRPGGGTSTPALTQNVAFTYEKTQAPLAVVISNGTSPDVNHFGRIQFWIETDKFSLLQVSGSWQEFDIYNFDPSIRVHLEFANFATDARLRYIHIGVDIIEVFVVPFWTVIIEVDKGKVTGLRWDNTCSGCKYSCIEGACSVPYEHCRDNTNGVNCDLQVRLSPCPSPYGSPALV